MKFVIGTIAYFNSIGFNTNDWRKSIDGLKAIVHENFVKVLIPNAENDSNLTVYNYPSSELDIVLNSKEWAIKEVI